MPKGHQLYYCLPQGMPRQFLAEQYGMYNARVKASNGDVITWNVTLGFKRATNSDTWPLIELREEHKFIQKHIDWAAGELKRGLGQQSYTINEE